MSHCFTLWVLHYLMSLFFPLFKFVRYQSRNIISQKEISQIIHEVAEANVAELPEATSCALHLFLSQVREQWLLRKTGRESLGVCFGLWRSHCSVDMREGVWRNKPNSFMLFWKSFFFLTPQIQSSHYQVEPEQSGIIQTLLDRLLGQRTACVKHQDVVYPLIANVCSRCNRGRRDT